LLYVTNTISTVPHIAAFFAKVSIPFVAGDIDITHAGAKLAVPVTATVAECNLNNADTPAIIGKTPACAFPVAGGFVFLSAGVAYAGGIVPYTAAPLASAFLFVTAIAAGAGSAIPCAAQGSAVGLGKLLIADAFAIFIQRPVRGTASGLVLRAAGTFASCEVPRSAGVEAGLNLAVIEAGGLFGWETVAVRRRFPGAAVALALGFKFRVAVA